MNFVYSHLCVCVVNQQLSMQRLGPSIGLRGSWQKRPPNAGVKPDGFQYILTGNNASIEWYSCFLKIILGCHPYMFFLANFPEMKTLKIMSLKEGYMGLSENGVYPQL